VSIALLQTALPDYRRPMVELLTDRLDCRLVVYAGDDYFDASVRTALPLQAGVARMGNHFIGRRNLLWQSGCWRELVRADVVVAELNPRVLSTWAVLLVRRLAGRATILWGHAWPRSGPGARSDLLRHVMRKLATSIVVYTETQAKQLRERMPGARVVAAPNALLPAALPACPQVAVLDSFVFVGRLVPAKKPLLLLEAFLSALPALPEETRLVFVGDGPLRPTVEKVARQAEASRRVVVTGHISDTGGLARIYARALASVSPGYVGLSLVQSLAFGVPMIVARDEPHSPEIEAAVAGFNCRYFESDRREELAAALVDAAKGVSVWAAPRSAIAADCVARYSLEVMVDRLAGAIEDARRCES
jgi:glycosyltransferase involved in cell wall biosynthesis